MPKGRMINKTISIDEEVAKLSDRAIILYTWAIPHLDVEGKILADATILKGVVVPYLKSFTLKVIEKCVNELGSTSLVCVYGNGHKYMKFLGFDKNQNHNKDREAPSEIPDPTLEQLQSKSRLTPAKVKLSKVKLSKDANAQLSGEDFIKTLKTNPAYKGIDINRELGKMDAWLLSNPGRQKTKRFIVNWLNKIDKPIGPITNEIKPTPDPKCDICHGVGKIIEGEQKGATCLCVKVRYKK
jgi:hypothetical protein